MASSGLGQIKLPLKEVASVLVYVIGAVYAISEFQAGTRLLSNEIAHLTETITRIDRRDERQDDELRAHESRLSTVEGKVVGSGR